MPEPRTDSEDSLVDSVHPTLPRWVTGPEHDRLRAPASVGRYEVGSLLGQGGGGTVFAGRDEALGREVAIKFVRCAGGSTTAKRVLREARGLARLSHPNIVHIYDYGRLDETLYLVMELVDGATLSTWLEEPSGWERVLRLFIEIGRGLSAAHAAGVVHRDFKPSNVIVGNDGRPRILDFGLAQLSTERADAAAASDVRPVDSELTGHGAVLGTPKFMSPEQWEGGGVDERSDQFSFCLTLFTGVYGRPPFSMDDLMQAASGIELPPPDVSKTAAVPRAVRLALLRGLSQSPADRWPSMDALIEALASPLQRRRRVVTAVGGALVVAAAGYGFVVDKASACDDLGPRVPRFGDGERAAVTAAFDATQRSYAADSLHFVAGRMDEFVARWHEVAEETCLAGERGASTSTAVQRRQACLDAQRRRYGDTLDVLQDVSATTLAGVADAVSSLPAPEDCRRAATKRLAEPVRAAVDRADILRRAASLDAALEAITPALSGDGTAPEALHVRGLIYEDRSDFTAAIDDLQRAYRSAESQGRDALVGAIAVDLIRLLGYRTSRSDEAQAFVLTAAAKIDRTVPEHHVARAELAGAVGHLELRRGRPEAALAAFGRALAMRESIEDEGLDLAADLNRQANALSQLERNDEARQSLQRALTIRLATVGPAHPLVGSNRLNLGHVADALGEVETAVEHFTAASEILSAALGPEHTKTAGAYSALASLYADAGREQDALAMWDRTLAVYDGAGMLRVAAEVRGNVGLFLRDRERLDDAETVLRRAVDDLERDVDEDHPVLAQERQNLATVLRQQGKLEEAMALARVAGKTYAAVYGPASADVVRTEETIGLALASLQRWPEIIERSETRYRTLTDDELDRRSLGWILRYSDALREVGRPTESVAALRRARTLATKHGIAPLVEQIDAQLEVMKDG